MVPLTTNCIQKSHTHEGAKEILTVKFGVKLCVCVCVVQ